MPTEPNNPTPNGSETDYGRFAQAWAQAHDPVRLFVESVIWNRHDAEDVTQEVAYKAGRGFASYDPEQPFVAWVMGIARNEIRMHLRTRSRDRHAFGEQLLDLLADSAVQAHDELNPRAAALRECMRQLPEPAKALLRMRYADQQQASALAERLGLTINAVHQRLKRVRSALGKCIDKRLAEEGIHG
ncbi:MAG: sigma-70 family RNA polymerase sigma factor [Planctomycetota bacterium]